MTTIQQTSAGSVNRAGVMWLAVGLALLAAITYLMIAQGILSVGDLQVADRPPAIIYVAAGSYLLGGVLILLHRRWLWVFGAIMNALVIVFFVQMYLHRPAVLLSAGGLASKSAQLLLEMALLYLIGAGWQRTRPPA